MATASISIEVDEDGARTYAEASDEDRRKLQLLVSLGLQELNARGQIVFLGSGLSLTHGRRLLGLNAPGRIEFGEATTEASEKAEPAWTRQKNARRCELINEQLDRQVTESEEAELEQLQREMLVYREQVAPLPLEYVEGVYQALLARAAARSKGQQDDSV